jgi:hypothetical protein
MKKVFLCIRFAVMTAAIVVVLAGCRIAPPTPDLTGNSSEIRDVLGGKNFMYRSGGVIWQSWYLTFNYDGTYTVTVDGTKIAKGTYSVSGTTVNLMPMEILEYADIFGLWQGTLDSTENPKQLKWNMAVYKLVTDKQ